MAWTPPPSAQLFPVRPLHGVWRSIPTQQIPFGGFYDLENVVVTEQGLLRRDAMVRRGSGIDVPEAIQEVVAVWKTDGSRPQIILSDRNLYNYPTNSGITLVEWEYHEAVALAVDNAGVVTLTAPVTGFIDGDVKTGDQLFLTFDPGTGIETRSWFVDLVVSATSVTLLDYDYATAITLASVNDWVVQKTLGPGLQPLLDWAVLGRAVSSAYSGILLAGGKRALVRWDQELNTLDYFTTDSAKMFGGVPFVPDCVAFFMDRVWAGGIYNSIDGYRRQRIIWSNLADSSNFSTATNYIDLPYLASAIKRLVPMGNTLIVYFGDGIFVGTPTQYPLLPLRFDRLDTGGVGLIGPKAVAPWFGGHFFVGQDDIYWLPYGSSSPQAIGTRIFNDAIRNCAHKNLIRAVADPSTSSILFGFPDIEENIEHIWYFHTKLKEWSSSKVNVESVSNTYVVDTIAWDGLTGTWDDGLDPGMWDESYGNGEYTALLFGSSGKVWIGNKEINVDFETQEIPVVIETGDIDFDAPDTMKTVLRMNLKVDRLVDYDAEIQFTAYTSTNKGRNWRKVGILRIPTTEDEGKVDFRVTGSFIRMRLVSSTMTTSYTIAEYGLRVVGSGDELALTEHS